MFTLSFVFYLVAVILFILAALPIPSPVNLLAAGLAFFAAGHMV